VRRQPEPFNDAVAKGDTAMAALTESLGWPYFRAHLEGQRDAAIDRLIRGPQNGKTLEQMYALAATAATLSDVLNAPRTIAALAIEERKKLNPPGESDAA
jgi:hypothetical protein